ncbi:MAG: ParB/RepB/Spo0J family partition protein [Planctomycetaceae bacterium]|nr:ParB/RepB/Spo0J family partition protein [Planctomycetaceae bacterium]
MSKSKAFLEKLGSQIDESLGKRSSRPAEVIEHPSRSAKYEGRTRAKDVAEIPLDQIIVDPQHREQFDESEIQSLADDLNAHGLIQAIVVRWDSPRRKYVIIAGERRYRAAQRAGWSRIECKEKPENITPGEIAEIQLSENFARKHLNPIELAKAFQDVINKNNWTARDLAKRLGVNETTVTRQLRFLKLPDDIQQSIIAGKITKTAAREIARLKDTQAQRQLAATAVNENLTSNEVTTTVSQQQQPRRHSKRNRRPKLIKTCRLQTEFGEVTLTPKSKAEATYPHMESMLTQALEEIRHRIANNVRY